MLKADLLKTWFPSVAVQLLRLLAGGHLIQCGRPDIPGTEEKKSQRKKNAPKSTLRMGSEASPRGVGSRLFFAARAAQTASYLSTLHSFVMLAMTR